MKFDKVAAAIARAAGSPWTFMGASGLVVIWAALGPVFGFSERWQMFINSSTTIVTFLMVFLIQNSQNRDNEAIQLKLNELIRANNNAHDALLDIEELQLKDLDKLKVEYRRLAKEARAAVRAGRSDYGSPELHRSTDGHHHGLIHRLRVLRGLLSRG